MLYRETLKLSYQIYWSRTGINMNFIDIDYKQCGQNAISINQT